MTPNRAATVFRELLQTPDQELGQFASRAGLHGQPDAQDLVRARELLEAVAAALESNRSPDWNRIEEAWKGMRTKHAPAPTTAAAAAADGYVAEPAAPVWVRDEVLSKPSLGSPAPGSVGAGESPKSKFIPVAHPRHVPNSGAEAPPNAAHAQTPLAASAPPTQQAMPTPPPPQVQAHAQAEAQLPAMPAMLAPVGTGSGQPIVPQAPEGFTAAAQPPAVPPAAAPERPAPPPSPRPEPPAAQASPPAAAPAPGAAAGTDAGAIDQSVAKYAAFCAACAEFPDRLADTMAGYGIGDVAQRAALDQLWQDRFDDEPEVMSKWEELFAHFRGSFRQRR